MDLNKLKNYTDFSKGVPVNMKCKKKIKVNANF